MSNKVAKQLGIRVRYLRRKRNLSQEQLAEKTDSTRVSISKVELGKVHIGVDFLDSLARALDVTSATLLEDRKNALKSDALRKEFDHLLNKATESELRLLYKIVDAIIN